MAGLLMAAVTYAVMAMSGAVISESFGEGVPVHTIVMILVVAAAGVLTLRSYPIGSLATEVLAIIFLAALLVTRLARLAVEGVRSRRTPTDMAGEGQRLHLSSPERLPTPVAAQRR